MIMSVHSERAIERLSSASSKRNNYCSHYHKRRTFLAFLADEVLAEM